MKTMRQALCPAVVLLLVVALPGLAQQAKKGKPLTEAALIKLAEADLGDNAIIGVIKDRGLAFKVDEAALKRLRDGGVSEAVLAALKPAEQNAREDTDGDKPLATVKTEDGLILDVLEARQTRNETFLIRWRYRNPTNRTVELIAKTGAFRVPVASLPEKAAYHFRRSLYYLEGKFLSDTAHAVYPLVVEEGREKTIVAKDLPKSGVRLGPDQGFEFWVQFPPPPHKDTRTITLHIMRTPLIRNIPVQPPER